MCICLNLLPSFRVVLLSVLRRSIVPTLGYHCDPIILLPWEVHGSNLVISRHCQGPKHNC